MRAKPKVGQKLFSLNIGDRARRQPQVLTPVVVTKVGRKYFTVANEQHQALQQEYHLENWRECYECGSACSCLYESEQEWLDEKEARRICGTLGEVFCYGANKAGLSLKALRQIEMIMSGECRVESVAQTSTTISPK